MGMVTYQRKLKSFDPTTFRSIQVSLLDLISVISNRNVRASMGNIKQSGKDATIVNDSRLFSEDDVKMRLFVQTLMVNPSNYQIFQ